MTAIENNVYEVTDLTLSVPPESVATRPEITLEEISILGGARAILLRNVLTKQECQYYIDQAEALGLQSVIESGYKATYRNNDRLVAMSPSLSSLLFERVSPFLEQRKVIDSSNDSQHHLGAKGVWQLHHVNDCFRLCRYLPGGHFSPHHDGEFVQTAGIRSLKTLMIYLNGDFEGGSTNFLDDDLELTLDPVTNRYVGLESAVITKVQPEAGMAIIFDHKILHEGAEVTSGRKYIMRTEAMYELVEKRMSPEEEEFYLLFQKAEKFEVDGESSEAVKVYSILRRRFPDLASLWRI